MFSITICTLSASRMCLESEHANHKIVEVSHVVIGAISKEMHELCSRVNGKVSLRVTEQKSIL